MVHSQFSSSACTFVCNPCMTAAAFLGYFRLVLCAVTTEIWCVLGCVGEVKQEDMTPLTWTLHLFTVAINYRNCGVMMWNSLFHILEHFTGSCALLMLVIQYLQSFIDGLLRRGHSQKHVFEDWVVADFHHGLLPCSINIFNSDGICGMSHNTFYKNWNTVSKGSWEAWWVYFDLWVIF